jgi:hypothetical protein
VATSAALTVSVRLLGRRIDDVVALMVLLDAGHGWWNMF